MQAEKQGNFWLWYRADLSEKGGRGKNIAARKMEETSTFCFA
jgi:hypothetical protein